MKTKIDFEARHAAEYDDFLACGGEGKFECERTEAELVARIETPLENVALELLRCTQDVATIPRRFVDQVLSSHISAPRFSADEMAWHSAACAGRWEDISGPTNYDRVNGMISLAAMILADAIVRHRRFAIGDTDSHVSNLGFGLQFHSSLSSAIVEFHRRIVHAQEVTQCAD